uniref:NADH-ubiquinone oxidoreductase chain 3 n=1 Tax=Colossendeis brevirostris TaxID=619823 RepID=A0A9E7V4K6_9CHEL|nr:NADH dehydrogenase subunit 3 [Colossendeis brevirostris]UYX57808.1 NADH dehydrogenase subunit 3 [Colossendeis brevirostris]
MKSILMMLILTLTIMFSLIMLSFMLSKKIKFDKEKNSPIECGMNPINLMRIPFSMQFFLLAIIFIIFDIEIAILMPIPIMMLYDITLSFLIMLSFLIILTLGLFYEWHNNALNWAI